jgi:SAM-dependent methyltransferase
MIEKLAVRAFKPVFVVYYRFLFGRGFAGAGKLAAWVRAWERKTGRQNVPVSGERWESEYEDGTWDFLRQSGELARYSVVAAFVDRFAGRGSVLDVGCGEGVLLEKLRPYGVASYTGIDLSEVAISRCSAAEGETARFLVADAELYRPQETFDAVVMNECLYYFEDPLAVALAYFDALADKGVLVVSQFRSRRSSAIARLLREKLPLIEETLITSRKGTWIVGVFGRGL